MGPIVAARSGPIVRLVIPTRDAHDGDERTDPSPALGWRPRRAKEFTLMNVFRRGHDPFWDLEGRGAKKTRRNNTIVSYLAFSIAVVACGMTAAAWLRILVPVFSQKLGLG